MNTQHFLSIDFGTTGVRAVVITSNGHQLGSQEQEVPISQNADGFAEQDVETFWQGMVNVVTRALAQARVSGDDVTAVGFSHQRCTFALADANGQHLCRLVVWMDQRGVPYLDFIRQRIPLPDYYAVTGLPIYYISSLTKLLWLRDQRPELYARARRVWPISNFMLTRLGVHDAPVDLATASFYGLLDTRSRHWATDLPALLGLDSDKLPSLVEPGAMIGTLDNSDAAAQLGLRPGTPLVIGGGDQQCAALGSGVIEPGRALINLGTATAVMAAVTGPQRDPTWVVPSVCHAVAGQWEMEGHTQASGVILRRFRDEFGSAESAVAAGLGCDAYELFSEQAKRSVPGAAGLLFLPMFNGSTAPVSDPYSSGALLGLRIYHTRPDVLRAMMEGMCLENRWILEHMQAQGTPIDTVYYAGGGSRSPFWSQLHADILQRPVVRVATSNATAVGVAISAGVATGLYSGVEEGVAALCAPGETYEPRKQHAQLYETLYSQFQIAYQALRDADVFCALRQIADT